MTRLFLICLLFTCCVPLHGQQPTTSQKTENSKPSDKIDPALLNWQSKDKYFLVVAATKTAGLQNNLPYAKVDGTKVDAVLSKRGYKRIDTLVDTGATREAFVERLKQIRTLRENSLVIIYYSGHAAPDPLGADLWLQLYGQSYFGESQGLAVSQLVKTARAGQYKGELVIIVDACYSGTGAWTNSLSLGELENTVIFTSSSRTQESFAVDISPTETMSAFTYYLLEGLSNDWDTVDEDKDGIIRYSDLQTYIDAQLKTLTEKDGQPGRDMTPVLSGQQTTIWAAFNPDKALNLTSLLRRALRPSVGILERQLPRILQPGFGPMTEAPTVPQTATELSKRVPANADPYTLALKAIAENRNIEALRLLDQAEKSHASELTDIYQARGSSRLYEGHFTEARDWLEKALAINKKENPELLEDAALVHLATLNISRSEELLSQAIAIRRKLNDSSSLRQDLIAISMVFMMQGRFNEARSSLTEVKAQQPQVSSDDDLGPLAEVTFVIVTLSSGDVSAAEKIATEIAARPINQSSQLSVAVAHLILSAVYAQRGEDSKRDDSLKKAFNIWEQRLKVRDSDDVGFLVEFAGGYQAGSERLLGLNAATRFLDISQKSVELLKTKVGSSSSEVSAALLNLGLAYLAEHKFLEAERFLNESTELARKVSGETNLISLYAMLSLGSLYETLERYGNSEKAFKTAIEIAERVSGQNLFLEQGLDRIGRFYKARGRYEEAATNYQRVIEINRQNGMVEPCSCLTELASIYQKLNRNADAEVLLKQALDLTRRSTGEEHPKVADALIKLGVHYYLQKDLGKARQAFQDAIKTLTRNSSFVASTPYAITLFWLSEVSYSERRTGDAKSRLEEAIAIAKALPGEEQDSIVSAIINLASEYVARQMTGDAERVLQSALYLSPGVDNGNRSSVATNFYAMGGVLRALGKYGEATQLYIRAITIHEKLFGVDHVQLANGLVALAGAYHDNRQYIEAVSRYKAALKIAVQSQDQTSQALITLSLGLTYLWLNDYSEADTWLSHAKDVLEKLGLSNSIQYSDCLIGLAVVASARNGAYSEAEKLAQRAVSIDEPLGQAGIQNLIDDLRILADIYRFQRRFSDADQVLRRTQQLLQKVSANREFSESKILMTSALLNKAEGKELKSQESVKRAIDLIAKRSVKDQIDFVSWLKYHGASLTLMKRENEAALLYAAAQQVQSRQSH